MRRVVLQVPSGEGERVMEIARDLRGVNLARFPVHGSEQPREAVLVHVSNRQVEALMARLADVPGVEITLEPQGVLALHPPREESPKQATNVEPRSPVEIYLSGLQSIGSWRGFLGYAAAAGAVVWIGLVTNTIYLLVGAMLIAPFAGPAMNAAIGTARGDLRLLGRSVVRYAGGIAVAVAVSALLTRAAPAPVVTDTMRAVVQLSTMSVLLPLTAGAAGALNIAQSQRTSLVSGAAVGLLVSAALAPPAGVLGATLVLGEPVLAGTAAFVLVLQFVGINAAATVVFRLFGVSPVGPRYPAGNRRASRATYALTMLLLALLVTSQLTVPAIFGASTTLQQDTLENRALLEVRAAVEASPEARFLDAEVRYASPDKLLVTVYVEPPGVEVSHGDPPSEREVDERVGQAVRARVLDRLGADEYGATSYVRVVTMMPAAPGSGR